MAKPKIANLVEVSDAATIIGSSVLNIWCDNARQVIVEISKLEGIEDAILLSNGNMIRVTADPRYDVEEIAQEIRDLLAADVPEASKE